MILNKKNHSNLYTCMSDVDLIQSIKPFRSNKHGQNDNEFDEQNLNLLLNENRFNVDLDASNNNTPMIEQNEHEINDLTSINTNYLLSSLSHANWSSRNSSTSSRSISSRFIKYRLFNSNTRTFSLTTNNSRSVNNLGISALTSAAEASETVISTIPLNTDTANVFNRSYTTNDINSVYSSNNNLTTLNPIESIIIRGDCNITLFGILNNFNTEFPSKLASKVAPEEFHETIEKINKILKKEFSSCLRWLIFGSICCCCTFGCSLLPIICINRKAKLKIKKLLMQENDRLYSKLGLKWKLTKQKYGTSTLNEYVLSIDILPLLQLYQPD